MSAVVAAAAASWDSRVGAGQPCGARRLPERRAELRAEEQSSQQTSWKGHRFQGKQRRFHAPPKYLEESWAPLGRAGGACAQIEHGAQDSRSKEPQQQRPIPRCWLEE